MDSEQYVVVKLEDLKNLVKAKVLLDCLHEYRVSSWYNYDDCIDECEEDLESPDLDKYIVSEIDLESIAQSFSGLLAVI